MEDVLKSWPMALAAVLVALDGAPVAAQPVVVNAPWTDVSPVADGVVGGDEWADAAVLPDGGGLAGATYVMWRSGLDRAGGSTDGYFTFLLHNIEQNTTFSNGSMGPAFNVFDVYASAADPFMDLEVTVRYDGFSVIRFDDGGQFLEQRSFSYGPGLAPEATADYDWDRYWGVYARGGYNNSAFDASLPLAVDNDNQVFEVILRGDSPLVARRSVKDPDQQRDWQVVEYNDFVVNPVPEPASWALFAAGALLVAGLARRRGGAQPRVAAEGH